VADPNAIDGMNFPAARLEEKGTAEAVAQWTGGNPINGGLNAASGGVNIG
jgi:hypothetical protein